MRSPSLRVCSLLLTFVASAGVARAEPPPSGADAALQAAVARTLREEGTRLLHEGRLGEAREKLEASVRHDPDPAALLALAACQEKLGATASAWGTYHRAEREGRMRGDVASAQEAVRSAAALEPRLSRVRIVVTPAEPLPEVTLDERPLPSEAWGVPLPLDPGSHQLGARSPGRPSVSLTFELAGEGETREVHVPELTAPPPAPMPTGAGPVAGRPILTESHPFMGPSRVAYAAPPPTPFTPNWRIMFATTLSLVCTGASVALTGLVVVVASGNDTRGQDTGYFMAAGGVVVGAASAPFLALAERRLHAERTLSGVPLIFVPMVAGGGRGLSLRGAF